MTLRHRYSVLAMFLLAAFLFVSAGCAPARNQQFRTSFLPPTPRAADEGDAGSTINEPVVDSDYFIHETPNLVPAAAVPPRIPIVDERLRRAEDQFDAGKRAYQQGRLEDARVEFNRAVDILLSAPETAVDRARLERRLDQMVDAIYRYDVNGLGAAEDADKVVYDKSPLDGILEMTFPMDPRLKPKVKEEIAATASQLPLQENDSVVSYIHFFSFSSRAQDSHCRLAAVRALSASDSPHSGRRGRAARTHLSCADRIRFPSPSGLEQEGRWHVAVCQVARTGIRFDTDPNY